jgi:hypothetical protein
MSDTLRRPSFIRDDASGEVRRYDPGVTPVRTSPKTGRPSERERHALGALVGNTKTRRDQLADAFTKLETEPKE